MSPGLRELIAGGSVLVVIVAALILLPVRAWSIELVTWIRDAGPLAVVMFAVVYVAAAVLFVPGSALTLGAGFAYGPVWGTLIVSPASIAAALVAFAIARRLGRGRIARRVQAHRRFAAIDRAVAGQGFKLTVLLRLSPIVPYTLLNYALGLTSVRFRDYAVGSAIGMLPGTVLYVYLGSLVTTARDLGAKPASAWMTGLYWGGLGCAVIVVVVVTRIARRALAEQLEAS